jgi:hypothetical protein
VKYGGSLLCVRYRFDESRGVRLKTVEIVVEEKPEAILTVSGCRYGFPVAFTEKALRVKLKTVGAKWEPEKKLWRVPSVQSAVIPNWKREF